MSIRNVKPAKTGAPIPLSWNTTHGLEVVTGSDIARIVLPEASANNERLLDAAAGHVCVLGAPPEEYVCLTMGIRLLNGVWQYEPGSSTGRVIRLDPNGVVEFYLVTGTPMNWYQQAYLDQYGNWVCNNLYVNGYFAPSSPIAGAGPGGTIIMRRALARMYLDFDFGAPSSSWQYIPFDRIGFDTGGFAGTVASQFLIPRPGYYTFSTTVTFRGPANRLPNTCGIRIMVADHPVGGGQTGRSDPDFPLSLSTTLTMYCSQWDTVGVQFYMTDWPDWISGGGWDGYTWFTLVYEGDP
jgi:hypothetical protein